MSCESIEQMFRHIVQWRDRGNFGPEWELSVRPDVNSDAYEVRIYKLGEAPYCITGYINGRAYAHHRDSAVLLEETFQEMLKMYVGRLPRECPCGIFRGDCTYHRG